MIRKPFRAGRSRTRVAVLGSLAVAATISGVGLTAAMSSDSNPTRPIAVNQTDGYGQGKLGAFTYYQNFACVHEPFSDLDGNGKVAAVDPAEFQTPRCVVGNQPGIDPAGEPGDKTAPLYVIVPFFDADGDGAAADPAAPSGESSTGPLATALKQEFGFVPDAFDPTPGVPVQCPEPGPPLTQHKGEFGTCTMHTTTLDLDPTLKALGLPPVGAKLPLVNHSHIIQNINYKPVWWQIRAVLVLDKSIWPNVEGTTGLTSVEAMRKAIADGKAIGDVPSNFYLFFDSRKFPSHSH
jgi:hypothetical protein